MGPIQASLNQLTLSTLGAIGGVAHGIKGTFAKPKAPVSPEAKLSEAQTTSAMGNIAKIGINKGAKGLRAYSAAAKAMESGNDSIKQKAISHYTPIQARLAEIKTASSLSVLNKGGSK